MIHHVTHPPKQYIATFGQQYSDLKDCYTIVNAESVNEAHQKLYRHYGNKWSMLYNSPEEAGVEKYNLSLLDNI
jgi:PhoPQ-activated pathogenicity-related protein